MSKGDYYGEEGEEDVQISGYREALAIAQEILEEATSGWEPDQIRRLQDAQVALRGINPPYRSVFVERPAPKAGKAYTREPVFSLAAPHHEPGVLSLRDLFFECDDPSCYLVGLAAFGSATVFNEIFKSAWANPYLKEWIAEWSALLEFETSRDLRTASRDGKVTATLKLQEMAGRKAESLGAAFGGTGKQQGKGRPENEQEGHSVDLMRDMEILRSVADKKGRMN